MDRPYILYVCLHSTLYLSKTYPNKLFSRKYFQNQTFICASGDCTFHYNTAYFSYNLYHQKYVCSNLTTERLNNTSDILNQEIA